MNQPELVRRGATTSHGKFYTPESSDSLLKDLPKPAKVPLDTDPPIPLWNTWPVLALFLAVNHGGMGFEKAQTTRIIYVRIVTISPRDASGREAGMDTSRLESRISALRSQVRRLLALHGMSWVVGLVVPIVIALGLADWGIHLDVAVRAPGVLMSLIGLAGWLAYRHVLPPLVVRFADLDIALRIEERWPGLNDRLASTIQFLRLAADNEDFGSPGASRGDDPPDPRGNAGDRLPPRDRAEADHPGPGPGVVAAAAALAILVSAAPRRAPSRSGGSSCPSGPDRWPQQTHLTLLDGETPRKVARGDPFTLAVTVGKGERVPASARATYRFDDGDTGSSRCSLGRRRPVPGPDRNGREVVHLLGRGGRRLDLGPQRRRQGRPAADDQGPDRPARGARLPADAPQTLAPGEYPDPRRSRAP